MEKVSHMFMIYNGELIIRSGYLPSLGSHREWAQDLNISEKDFDYIVRGVCSGKDNSYHASFYSISASNEDCISTARKFGPLIMQKLNLDCLEIFAGNKVIYIDNNLTVDNSIEI